jgi:hypothetical protein
MERRPKRRAFRSGEAVLSKSAELEGMVRSFRIDGGENREASSAPIAVRTLLTGTWYQQGRVKQYASHTGLLHGKPDLRIDWGVAW